MLVRDLTLNDFIGQFIDYDRNYYSQDGYEQLYDLCSDIEMDVIGICCDFTEYANFEELDNDYGYKSELEYDAELYDDMDDFEECRKDDLLDIISSETTLIKTAQDDGGEGYLIHVF